MGLVATGSVQLVACHFCVVVRHRPSLCDPRGGVHESVPASSETDSPVPAAQACLRCEGKRWRARSHAACRRGTSGMASSTAQKMSWAKTPRRDQGHLSRQKGQLPILVCQPRQRAHPGFRLHVFLPATCHQGRDRPQRPTTAPHDTPGVTLLRHPAHGQGGVAYRRTGGGSPLRAQTHRQVLLADAMGSLEVEDEGSPSRWRLRKPPLAYVHQAGFERRINQNLLRCSLKGAPVWRSRRVVRQAASCSKR